MSKVTFDGSAKTITVNQGETEIDVGVDVYSKWKEWMLVSDNMKYPPAMRTFGGDSTITGQYAPSYYFLTNGWRVIVDNQEVVFGTNMYTDEGESPIITINGGTASLRNSDAAIVKNELEDKLDYAGVVYIDSASPYAGTSHPTGTSALPVNNATDALAIGKKYGIKKYIVEGHINIIDDMYNSTFEGQGFGSSVSVAKFSSVASCKFVDLKIEGDFTGAQIQAKNCIIGDCENLSGDMLSCGISGNIKVSPYGLLTLDGCSSRIPGENFPTLDMNEANDVDLNIRGFSGGLVIINCDTMESVASIELSAGHIELLESCTSGFVYVRGSTTLIDNSNGTNVNISATIADQVWNRTDRSLTTNVGLKPEELEKLEAIHTSVEEIIDIQKGNWEIKGTQMIFYRRDGSELMRFNLLDNNGNSTTHKVFKREIVGV